MQVKAIRERDYQNILSSTKSSSLQSRTKHQIIKVSTLLFTTGCRISEILQLTTKSLDEIYKTKQTVIYTSKTDKYRTLYFTLRDIEYLKAVFGTPKKTMRGNIKELPLIKASSSANLTTSYNRNIKKLGLDTSSHKFRAGRITEMLSKDVEVSLVSAYIGHSNINTTRNYASFTDDDIKSALDKVFS
jgi:integrase/recombinase XerD